MKKVVIFFVGLILAFNFIYASFEIGDLSHSLNKTTYEIGEPIKGWINISLEDELADSFFEDSEGNSINLIDLLEKNDNFDYACNPADCTSGYSASSEQLTKTFNMNAGESKLVGFKLTGDINAITSINFTIQSDVSSSCTNQIGIDFFADRVINFENYKPLNTSCPSLKNYGCFNDSNSNEEYLIGEGLYCQRVKLSESPGFKVGAWIKEEIAGKNKLIMELYDIDKNQFVEGAYCEIPKEEISGAGGDIGCNINHLVTKSKDYYICIHSEGGSGTYKTKGYDSGAEICGFLGSPIQTETNSYKIFAEGRKFAAIENLEITNSLPDGTNLRDLMENYIIKKYGVEMNCPSEGCIIPIVIEAKRNQELTISGLKIEYEKVGAITTSNKFYDLTSIPATVSSSNFQKLYLDKGNFYPKQEFGESLFRISLNNEEIFSEDITIEMTAIRSLTPTTTASAYPTQFEVKLNYPKNITNYKWDFGDNSSETTSVERVSHTYYSTGNYSLRIEITDSNQKSSYRIFNILVVSPEEIISSYLEEMQKNLVNINSQLNQFPKFQKESLSSILNLEDIDSKLKQLKKEYASTYSEQEYNEILTELLGLQTPESIRVIKKVESILFLPDENDINLDILKSIGKDEEDLEDENIYIKSIIFWNQENIDTRIDFEDFVASYGDFEEPILKTFTLKINQKESVEHTPYLILRKLDNLNFYENYLETDIDGYIYIELKQPLKTITFSTTEDIDFETLPLFISPPISRLDLIDKLSLADDEEETFKWVSFILIIFLVFITGTIVYIILQEWYKRKYENYLFKNRNNLYNLISYIETMKRKGVEEKEIKSKLKKAGWSSEQVNYALRKYVGKRTGMLEIPIKKILGVFKKSDQKNLQKRNTPVRDLGQRESFTKRF
jgi:PKD repeat protein